MPSDDKTSGITLYGTTSSGRKYKLTNIIVTKVGDEYKFTGKIEYI
jgi:hypothetical protein